MCFCRLQCHHCREKLGKDRCHSEMMRASLMRILLKNVVRAQKHLSIRQLVIRWLKMSAVFTCSCRIAPLTKTMFPERYVTHKVKNPSRNRSNCIPLSGFFVYHQADNISMGENYLYIYKTTLIHEQYLKQTKSEENS